MRKRTAHTIPSPIKAVNPDGRNEKSLPKKSGIIPKPFHNDIKHPVNHSHNSLKLVLVKSIGLSPES